jgi:sialate O-acetylesterase
VVAAGSRQVINDVLVGDVWLCSGQSNMFFYVRQADHAAEEIANARHPLLREFLVKSIVSDDPLAFADGEWETCTPQTVPTFTAVGYFFARDLQREIHVPIGIIRATLGGSPIEGWLSEPALAGDPAFKVVGNRWETMRATRGKGDRNQPSGLYNGLIHPLEPFALAGFVWYQGEGNHAHPTEYGRLFRTMISQWRADFRQGDLPFLFVQLPGYDEPGDLTHESWAWLREEQASALDLPRTGMAVALDLGEPKDHHPTNKQEVGRRLALVALRRFYGRANEDSGPIMATATREGAAFRVSFRNATGLKVVGDPAELFLIAGADRRFVRATAQLQGESVLVSTTAVPEPVAVRFEWMNVPTAYLKNAAGMPAPPFRTDHWPAEAGDVHRP